MDPSKQELRVFGGGACPYLLLSSFLASHFLADLNDKSLGLMI